MRALRALIAVAAFSGTTAFLSTGSAAAAGTTIQPGHVVLISDVAQPLPSLPKPASGGPIAGYGFSASVTGLRCARSVGSGAAELRAAAGYDLCVFSLAYATHPVENEIVTDEGQSIPATAARVSFGSTSIPLSSGDLDKSFGTDYAVDVTPGQPVMLSISAADYSQSYSLSSGEPIGPRPIVLYSKVPAARVNLAEVTLTERDQATGRTAGLKVSVAAQTLTWFLPGDPLVHPSSPDDAYLGLELNAAQIPGPGGTTFADIPEFPGSAVQLRYGSTTVSADEQGGLAIGPLSGTYSFVVPDSLSSATLVLDPSNVLAYQDSPASGPDEITFGASSRSNSVVPVAAGAAGGTVVIVVPLVLFWRRRRDDRKGRAVDFSFPTQLPSELPIPAQSSAGREESEENGHAPAREEAHEAPTEPATPVAEPPEPRRPEINLIGPLQVLLAHEPKRQAVSDLAAVLAVEAARQALGSEAALEKGRPVSSESLCEIFGKDGVPILPRTLWNRVSELRQAIGEELIETEGASYRLKGGFDCDWLSFCAVTAAAGKTADRAYRIKLLSTAVELVRGRPFAGASPVLKRYAEKVQIIQAIEVAVVEAAHELCGLLLADGRCEEAERAATRGLRADECSYVLCEDLMRATSVNRARFDKTWSSIVANPCVEETLLVGLRDQLLAAQRV